MLQKLMFSTLLIRIKKIRAWESLAMTPFFLIGYFYSKPHVSEVTGFKFLILVFHFYLLVQSIYLLNSFYGKMSDKLNKRFQGLTIEKKSTEIVFVLLSIILFALSYLINFINEWNGGMLILINYVLWLLYANPKTNYKSHFVLASIIHFVSGIINFQLGYQSGQSSISLESFSISIYFSLLFVFGHAHHMIIDYEADKASNHKTLAVKIGIAETSRISMILLFVTTFIYTVLAFLGWVIALTVLPVIIAFICHIILYYKFKNKLHNHNQRITYRERYRIIHALSMLIIAAICIYDGTI